MGQLHVPDNITAEEFRHLAQSAVAEGSNEHRRTTLLDNLSSTAKSAPEKRIAQLICLWLGQDSQNARKAGILLACTYQGSSVYRELPPAIANTVKSIEAGIQLQSITPEELSIILEETVDFLENPPLARDLEVVLERIRQAASKGLSAAIVYDLTQWNLVDNYTSLKGTAQQVFDYLWIAGLEPTFQGSGPSYHIRVTWAQKPKEEQSD